MTNQSPRLKIGEGKISGYLSVFLAIVSLGFVICAYFPDTFTTKDFREIYNPQIVKWSILGVLVLSFVFAFGIKISSFIFSRLESYFRLTKKVAALLFWRAAKASRHY